MQAPKLHKRVSSLHCQTQNGSDLRPSSPSLSSLYNRTHDSLVIQHIWEASINELVCMLLRNSLTRSNDMLTRFPTTA